MKPKIHIGWLMLCALLLCTGNAAGQSYPGPWKSRWIWSGEARPFHYFLMARRGFDLSSAPTSATLRITAADRYLLYVNGQYLGRGPARSDCRYKSYDTYDVGARLKQGRNVIAVLAYYYGCQNMYTRDDRAGLFTQLDLTEPDGRAQIVGTDGHWRVRQAQGWSRNVDLINMAVGVTEIYDAKADPPDWMTTGFNDSGWTSATVIADTDCPWAYLERRQTPMLEENEIFPARVIQTGEVLEISRTVNGLVDSSPGKNQVPERLGSEIYLPLQNATIKDSTSVLISDGRPAVFQAFPVEKGKQTPTGRRSPYVIVDFGRHVFGYPKVRLSGSAGVAAEMTYGPSLIEGRILPISQGVRYGDRYELRGGEQTWQVFEYKQFRYLLLIFRDAEAPVSVDSISLVSCDYPAPVKGRFECSDPVLNKIWKACIDTVYLQMEDAMVVDAVRERRIWTGDGAHGLWAIWAGFGDVAISDWYFRLLARGAKPDGMLRVLVPGTEFNFGSPEANPKRATVLEEPGGIPQHGLAYAAFVGEFNEYFGKRALVEELYPVLVRFEAWFNQRTDSRGLVANLAGGWVDWTGSDLRGANFQTNALYFQMLRRLTQLATELNRGEEATRYSERADTVSQSLRTAFWNSGRGLFVDSVVDDRQSEMVTEVANAMALCFGIATPDQATAIIRSITDPKVSMPRASPLFFEYVIEGLFRAGAPDEAVALLRDRFAPMMAASDPPTIWETWDPLTVYDWVQVHLGGVGPAWGLSRHVLGVQAAATGFAACRIEPRPGGLTWARGLFPSVRGDIAVDWKNSKGRFSMDVELPEGLDTDLVVRRDPNKVTALRHNDVTHEIPAGDAQVAGIRLDGERVIVRATGGRHHLEITPR